MAFAHRVQIWCDVSKTEPLGDSGKLNREDFTLDGDNSLCCLSWHPSGHRLAALTWRGQVLIFDVEVSGSAHVQVRRVAWVCRGSEHGRSTPLFSGRTSPARPSMGADASGMLVCTAMQMLELWDWDGQSQSAPQTEALVRGALGGGSATAARVETGCNGRVTSTKASPQSPSPALSHASAAITSASSSLGRRAAGSVRRVPAKVVRRSTPPAHAATPAPPAVAPGSPVEALDDRPAGRRERREFSADDPSSFRSDRSFASDAHVASALGLCAVVRSGVAVLVLFDREALTEQRGNATGTMADGQRSKTLADILEGQLLQPPLQPSPQAVPEARSVSARAVQLRVRGAQQLDMCPSSYRVAVGTNSGEVAIFEVPWESAVHARGECGCRGTARAEACHGTLQPTRLLTPRALSPVLTLTPTAAGFQEGGSSAVGALRFSSAGNKLAIGWQGPSGGAAIFFGDLCAAGSVGLRALAKGRVQCRRSAVPFARVLSAQRLLPGRQLA